MFLFPGPPAQDPIRHHAIRELWRKAADTVVIRYPAQHVRVNLAIDTTYNETDEVRVRFEINGVHDTAIDRSGQVMHGFAHVGYVVGWPGFDVAKAWLASMWTLYLAHEAQELVTHKGRPHMPDGDDAVINPHGSGSESQRLLHTAQLPSRMGEVVAWAMGSERAKALIESNAEIARLDTASEIADWTPSV